MLVSAGACDGLHRNRDRLYRVGGLHRSRDHLMLAAAGAGDGGLHRSRDHLMLASDDDLDRCWRW